MINLVRTSAAITTTEIALMIVAIMRNKYLAVTIGPEGFGIYGLLTSFFNFAAVLSGTWLATGATKYSSEYREQNNSVGLQTVCGLSISLVSVISLIMSIFFILFQEPIRIIFLSEDVLPIYFSIFAISFVGMSIRPVIVSLLQGLMQVKEVVITRLIISLVEISTVIVLVYLFDLAGFFLSILISSIVAVILFISKLNKSVKNLSLITFKFGSVGRKLLHFGGINLLLAALSLFTLYFQRKIILDQIGLVHVGFLAAVTSIRNYSDIVGRGSGFYFFPRMSENLNAKERRRELNDYIFFSLLVYVPIAIIIIFFSKFLVEILFSNSFMQIIPVIPLFILAEYMHNLDRPFGQAIVGMALLKIHALKSFLASILWLIIPFFYASEFGLKSIAISYILGSTVQLFIAAFYLKYRAGFAIEPKNILVAVLGFTLILFSSITAFSVYINIAITIIVVIGLYFLLNTEQKERVKIIVQERLSISSR